MSIVSLLGIKVLNNPAKFTDPYEFEITFECLEQLKDDLEWKLTYVGSSRSLEHDQELDSILVGPIPVGINKFILTADAPSPELIPASELVSVTVILLSCSYKEREFVRVGYYVNNEYDSEELRENPPTKVQVDHIVRNILAEKPRVTRFNIVWDNEGEMDEYPPEQGEGEDENGEAVIDMGANEDEDEEDADEEEVEEEEEEDGEDDEVEEEEDGEEDDVEEEEDGEDEEVEEAEDVEEAEEAEEVEEAEEEVVRGSDVNSNKTSDVELETAKRQNTINDDDIPEIKRQKLKESDEERKTEEREEDLEELEAADEEALEKEELEDEEELGREIEGMSKLDGKGTGSNPESTAEVEVTEVITTVDQEAETPKIDSAAPTPTESAN